MAKTKASALDAPTQTQATNDPRDYVMLREKRILYYWREKGQTVTLKPSQAEYHLRNKNLVLKEERQ